MSNKRVVGAGRGGRARSGGRKALPVVVALAVPSLAMAPAAWAQDGSTTTTSAPTTVVPTIPTTVVPAVPTTTAPASTTTTAPASTTTTAPRSTTTTAPASTTTTAPRSTTTTAPASTTTTAPASTTTTKPPAAKPRTAKAPSRSHRAAASKASAGPAAGFPTTGASVPAAPPVGTGYWVVTANGGVFGHGPVGFYGAGPDRHLRAGVIGLVPTPDGRGYWMVTAAGMVVPYGDAPAFGSGDPALLRAPVRALVPTPDGMGYWMITTDGGVFTFGDAHYYGSAIHQAATHPVAAMTVTPDGKGYWVATTDGRVFAYGDARSYGSGDPSLLRAPVADMVATPDGLGYWMITSTGGVFTFGDASYFGSAAGKTGPSSVVSMVPASDGQGYWIVTADDKVLAMGDAKALPAAKPDPITASVVGIVVPRQGPLRDVPMSYIVADHQAAATCPGLPWTVLAAVANVESDFGRSQLPGVTSGTNFAGAAGPMQMGIAGAAGPTFQAYDHPVAADEAPDPKAGAVPANPYDLVDAVFAATRDLCSNGGGKAATLRRAVLAYNHSSSYADEVMALSSVYGGQYGGSSEAVRVAMTQLGVPYLWGGEIPYLAFDCSGLVQWTYRTLGITLPRTSQEQWATLRHLPAGATPAPGDLVFFGPADGPTHVGIYVGNGMMIDAPHTGAVVRVEPYRWSDYLGAALP
jgi:cell wall-associated NlpC family hydrolase